MHEVVCFSPPRLFCLRSMGGREREASPVGEGCGEVLRSARRPQTIIEDIIERHVLHATTQQLQEAKEVRSRRPSSRRPLCLGRVGCMCVLGLCVPLRRRGLKTQRPALGNTRRGRHCLCPSVCLVWSVRLPAYVFCLVWSVWSGLSICLSVCLAACVSAQREASAQRSEGGEGGGA